MWKKLFFILIVRPVILLVTGIHVCGRENLPRQGPCIIAANHNSHLDTLALMSLFPLAQIESVRPAAAADYFFKNKILTWFSLNVLGIIPVQRKVQKKDGHPLKKIHQALDAGESIIFFPEGSRGEPERMMPFKNGIAHLARRYPDMPVLPVYIHGAGKSLPRGEALLVPFILDVKIAAPLQYNDMEEEGGKRRQAFINRLEKKIHTLQLQGGSRPKRERTQC